MLTLATIFGFSPGRRQAIQKQSWQNNIPSVVRVFQLAFVHHGRHALRRCIAQH
jgi:hypothetical protein